MSQDIKLFINGKAVAGSGGLFETINPATGEVLATVHAAATADVEAAVAAAAEAQRGWAALSGLARGRILQKVCNLLREKNDELAHWETLDSGKPIQESQSVDIHWAADCFEYYAGIAPTISGEHIYHDGGFAYTRREPLGVCAGIGAWNYPLQVASWKIAPALACGNAMIYKPAELTPITAFLLGDIMNEAGVPPGVYNVVQGDGTVGAMLSRHPAIAKVSLTGETGTGKLVMADAADTLKQVTMELGGKSPLVVFADADINEAVSAAMLGNFYTQGEVCTNCTRVFVHKNIKDAFVAQLLERTKKLIIGEPTDSRTQIGALINKEHRQKVLHYIESGVVDGATLLIGGAIPDDAALAAGAFVLPTVFDNCRDDMRIVREEIFGPVMTLLTFDDENEVIDRANNTTYGLAAGLFTRDISRAHRVAAQLQAGMCWINSYGVYNMHMPAGGFKHSGLGTENGIETLRQYTQTKTVYVEFNGVDSPYD